MLYKPARLEWIGPLTLRVWMPYNCDIVKLVAFFSGEPPDEYSQFIPENAVISPWVVSTEESIVDESIVNKDE